MDDSFLDNIIKFVGMMALTILLILWGGFVLSILWGWLIVPVFSVPDIGIAEAIGLTIILSLTVKSRSDKENKELVYQGIATPLVALFLGYIVHFFI